MKHLFQKVAMLAVIFATCVTSKDCPKIREKLEANPFALLSHQTYDAFNIICRGSAYLSTQVIANCGPTFYANVGERCCTYCVTDGGEAKRGCQERFQKSLRRVLNRPGQGVNKKCRNAVETLSYFIF